MPAQELDIIARKQPAVLWFRMGVDRYGQPVVSQPTEILTRWVDKRHEVVDPHGATIAADVVVVLDRFVPIATIFWKGRLVDLPSGDPALAMAHILTLGYGIVGGLDANGGKFVPSLGYFLRSDTGIGPPDLMQLIRINVTKDLKGRATRITGSLMRFKDQLPTVGGTAPPAVGFWSPNPI